ncbi:HET-domain-containing protein [Hypomontagnella monticulosa]|nr:HET-domain-containing protein [Hypomontagnella monticulosa]
MWLLNTENGNLEEFFGAAIPSEYAVLSHRWGDEEVSFRDWLSRSSRPELCSKSGFRKIKHCCEVAKSEGIKWVWIDTCCIDKTSSQDLSEAINSMFQWYQNSTVCYAYLEDYTRKTLDAVKLGRSEWFFRGWTLQELIAPKKVDFYNKNWRKFGTKTDEDMCKAIEEITKIDAKFLCGSDLESASIAKKMSWASKRETSRIEDEAYCLLGIFDINMPLLYGEGHKAFKRLQEGILKTYPEDHSLYAWGIPVNKPSIQIEELDESIIKSMRGNTEKWPGSSEPLHGLLADSPRDFEFSRNYSPLPQSGMFYTNAYSKSAASYPIVTGKGLRIELPYISSPPFYYQYDQVSIRQVRSGVFVVLLCKDDTDDELTLCLPLLLWGSGLSCRSRELYLDHTLRLARSTGLHLNGMPRITITANPEKKFKFKSGDILIRSFLDLRDSSKCWLGWLAATASGVVLDNNRVIHGRCERAGRYVTLQPRLTDYKDPEEWQIILGRVNKKTTGGPAFQAGISLIRRDVNPLYMNIALQKVFQSPAEDFIFESGLLPVKVEMRVERHALPEDGGFIDVVDIIFRDKKAQNDDEMPIEEIKSHPEQSPIERRQPSDVGHEREKKARKKRLAGYSNGRGPTAEARHRLRKRLLKRRLATYLKAKSIASSKGFKLHRGKKKAISR